MAPQRIRVLVVDDSAVVRNVLTRVLSRDPEIEVVGAAGDPYEARDKIVSLQPDVVTLDIEMPRMDGLAFLDKLMTHHPLPVVMCSSVTHEGAGLSLKAMELGAVDVVGKPRSAEIEGLHDAAIELVDKVKAAAKARVRPRRLPPPGAADEKGQPLAVAGVGRVRGTNGRKAAVLEAPPDLKRTQRKIIAIGASTGGTEALRVVLESLPREIPGIVIVQHMPEHFTLAFANRLDSLCEIEVREAKSGDRIRPGLALIARGNSHLIVRKSGAYLAADVRNGPLICRHRPSIEALFQSVAAAAGPAAVGVMLTGMGNDGANAMALLKQAGALNIAQDEASSVVFGMPKEAIKAGGVDRVEHLDRIPKAIIEFCCRP
jgi:two-component system chemotaxis response regulator CheB